MMVVVDGVVRTGRAVDLGGFDVSPADVAAAVDDSAPAAAPVRVDCPDPGPGHATLVRPDAPVEGRNRLLAAVARTRGLTAPEDRERAAVEADLAAVEVPEVDVASARERVADAGAETDRLRERVATLRGRLQARRETGAETAGVKEDLRAAARDLSEAATDRTAAEQALDAAERRARRARTRRRRRLELQDRADNLRRRADARLADRVAGAVHETAEAVPGGRVDADAEAESGPPLVADLDDVTLSLAAVRAAALDAPVVDATGRFDTAGVAAVRLDAPVVRVPHP